MKFPDFIIVGAMKCATTVLWHNLNKHPEIVMGKNFEDPKKASTEIRFWNNGQPHFTYGKGVNWYKGLFTGDCSGEKCANYIESQEAMKRIAHNIPKVKIIICVRNPVDRAYSEYNMQVKRNKIVKPSFTFEFAKRKGYIRRGEYYNMLERNVLPFFDEQQIYIVIQERMKADTNRELNNLYHFLGVSEYNLEAVKTTSAIATNRNLDLNADREIKSYKVWQSDYPSMDSVVENQLKKHFALHNMRLITFIGEDIPEWSEP